MFQSRVYYLEKTYFVNSNVVFRGKVKFVKQLIKQRFNSEGKQILNVAFSFSITVNVYKKDSSCL